MKNLSAITISIGDELLSGQTVDSNNAFISHQLARIGIPVKHKLIIGDNDKDIQASLEWAFKTADIITLTGGLGPTHDDITKHSLCSYFGVSLKTYPDILDRIRERFAKRGFKMAAINVTQAEYPENAELIGNPVGTAQGMHFVQDGRHLFVMPGVPREMKAMMQESVIPQLKPLTDGIIEVLNIHTNGIPESALYEHTKKIFDNYPECKIAYLPKHHAVTIRVSIRSETEGEHETLLSEIYEQVRKILPKQVYGRDDQSLSEALGDLLRSRGKTVATAESCTGGMIASAITDISGSSDYFETGIVSYANETKMKLLGVRESTLLKHGAVSEETVAEMLAGTLKISGSDYAIAVSGIAGPEGGTEEKPVGTVYIGIADKYSHEIRRFQFVTNRIMNKEMSTAAALNLLRVHILNEQS